MYCLVPEKPLRLFIPLIFSGGIWNFLLSHPALIQRLFFKFINFGEFLKSITDGYYQLPLNNNKDS